MRFIFITLIATVPLVTFNALADTQMIFDSKGLGIAEKFPKYWETKIKKEPSASAAFSKGFKDTVGLKYDVTRVILKTPGRVRLLVEYDFSGKDSRGKPQSFHLKKGETFESSTEGIGLSMSDGSDCIVRIKNIVIDPVDCPWVEGFNPEQRAEKFQTIERSGQSEIWYHITDAVGKSVGWLFRDWPLLVD